MLALQEAFTRYALPKATSIFKLKSPPAEIPQLKQTNQQFQENMQSLKAIINQIRNQNIPVFVLFTPNREDLLPTPQTPEYKTQFIQLLNSLQVPVIDTHTAWAKLPTATVKTYFRDSVHLSVAGNQAAADLLFKQLCIEKKLLACSHIISNSHEN
ncbi:MAG: SGNH/GDSL hydrolase family protein [Rivularia sp. (in: cyanobacteria)]